jgi:hypothetical protein
MTKTSNFASKLFVGFVATAMLFTLSYTPAKAATADELQAQINALLAQIATLQGGSSSSSSSCAAFTMDQTMGSKGAEVTALQNFLIGKGHAIAAGATGYFGAQSQAALAAFQSANGITPAAGYFGPITRAKVNGMCTVADDSNDDSNDDANDDDTSSDELSGEASLDDVTAKDGDDTDLEEGQEDAAVADFEVEFTDGDASISRIDVALVDSGTAESDDAWDTFEEISLWVDGEEVARESASDEDDYLDENDGTIRFSGLDIVAMEDESVTITVGVSVQGSVDSAATGADWRVDMESLRFFDAEDVATTEDGSGIGDMGTGNGVTFDIDEEGGDDELIVKSSSEDPDATTLAVEDNETSDWLTVFAFDLDTDDSTNDIEVTSLPVNLTVSSGTLATFVNDIKLVVDGNEFDDYTSDTAGYTFDIDSDELVIEAGERATVEVMVEFKQLALGNEGVTITGSVSSASSSEIEAEGADDLTGSQLSGSATGEAHTLRTTGVIGEANTDSATATTVDGSGNDYGTFVVKFDITAFEQDAYLSTNVATSISYQMEDNTGAAVGTGTNTPTLGSTADQSGGFYVVNEGETETFTLTVTHDPATTNVARRLQLLSVAFRDSASTPNQTWNATPAQDYETEYLTIVD